MKTLRIIPAFIIMVSMIACGPKPNDKGEFILEKPNGQGSVHIKFTNDGKIDYIQEYTADQPSGIFLEFNTNGTPKSMVSLVNGKKQGLGVKCFPDGSVNNIGPYMNNEESGYFWVWDRTGNLVEKREYVTADGKNQMNQWIRFNERLQPVFAESNFISVVAANDTIKEGEDYEVDITLEASYQHARMALIVGPFDENYQLSAGSRCDTLVSPAMSLKYKTKNYKKGLNTLRGVVKDIAVTEEKTSKSRNIYFTKEFFVTR